MNIIIFIYSIVYYNELLPYTVWSIFINDEKIYGTFKQILFMPMCRKHVIFQPNIVYVRARVGAIKMMKLILFNSINENTC